MIPIKPDSVNAFHSIPDNLDTDSNVTEESDRHSGKHLKSKISTELGKVKNSTSVPENPSFSISCNLQSISISIAIE
jgi:tRNA U54 and U55 pseudouridine synthase Pus10